MSLAGDIPIHFISKSFNNMKTVPGSSKTCLQAMKGTVEGGCGLAVFPEGKRNPNPENGMTEFKIGAFKIAKDTEADILPVTIDGTSKVWGVGKTFLDKGEVGVVFGNIIKQEDYEDASELSKATRAVMEELYEESRALARRKD